MRSIVRSEVLNPICAVVRVRRKVQGRKQPEELSESEGNGSGEPEREGSGREQSKGSRKEAKQTKESGAEKKRNERREAGNGRPT